MRRKRFQRWMCVENWPFPSSFYLCFCFPGAKLSYENEFYSNSCPCKSNTFLSAFTLGHILKQIQMAYWMGMQTMRAWFWSPYRQVRMVTIRMELLILTNHICYAILKCRFCHEISLFHFNVRSALFYINIDKRRQEPQKNDLL